MFFFLCLFIHALCYIFAAVKNDAPFPCHSFWQKNEALTFFPICLIFLWHSKYHLGNKLSMNQKNSTIKCYLQFNNLIFFGGGVKKLKDFFLQFLLPMFPVCITKGNFFFIYRIRNCTYIIIIVTRYIEKRTINKLLSVHKLTAKRIMFRNRWSSIAWPRRTDRVRH